jgi:NAD(P)-dependent dehydrogenase (short-subunit alcohol dehydrogenase family)
LAVPVVTAGSLPANARSTVSLDCAANVAGTHDGLGALTGDVAVEDFDQALDTIPAGRMATADEVAETIAWPCCEAPAYVTGASIVIDGGFTIQG